MMPIRLTRRLGVAALSLLMPVLLTACGGLVKLPNSGPAPGLYNLTAPSTVGASGTEALLLIEDPTVSGGLDTTLIARRSSPNELQFFAEARWAGRPSVMLQNTLVETFEGAGQAVSQARGGAVVPAQYELQVNLRDFQAEYFQGAQTPTVRVRLAISLVRLGPLASAGRTVIETTVQATSPEMPAVIAAFDQAVHDALGQTVAWTTERMRAAP
ncbi:ABC-type transport auxiliary lipoprotein family protein [Iodidimonas sp. SYSU 1G8]|uniref:ABC-type transport auxiliary lipoprotein family protein n=1 Tax=Iodidimonas sp. SYSU 1G8 TaxID=3133967 RepID=UPI0031FEA737